ncbi:MAG: oligopeptide transport system ATP-binding protein [Chlamydiales bacterium]
MSTPAPPLLAIRGLRKHFPITAGVLRRKAGDLKAVDGLSFELARNETLALVGESGCGKTTAARTILRLMEPTAGEAWFHPGGSAEPVDLFDLTLRQMRPYRSDLQIVFQDPFASLNPRITVGNALREALRVHGVRAASEIGDRVAVLLRQVGLRPELANRYPHEFSGGQRQRIGIARALAVEPRLIVCDEAVSALDVSIQAQIINLLRDLQDELGLSYIFIAHDLSVVRFISHRVAVMYLGRIVEIGSTEQIFEAPRHPYTQALLAAMPVADPGRPRLRTPLVGDVPSPANPPSGCHFHTRCPLVEERCAVTYPEETRLGQGHRASCHLID